MGKKKANRNRNKPRGKDARKKKKKQKDKMKRRKSKNAGRQGPAGGDWSSCGASGVNDTCGCSPRIHHLQHIEGKGCSQPQKSFDELHTMHHFPYWPLHTGHQHCLAPHNPSPRAPGLVGCRSGHCCRILFGPYEQSESPSCSYSPPQRMLLIPYRCLSKGHWRTLLFPSGNPSYG